MQAGMIGQPPETKQHPIFEPHGSTGSPGGSIIWRGQQQRQEQGGAARPGQEARRTMAETQAADAGEIRGYLYEHVTPKVLAEDTRFRDGALRPGLRRRSGARRLAGRGARRLLPPRPRRPGARGAALPRRHLHPADALDHEGIFVLGYTWYSLTDQVDWDIQFRETRGQVVPNGLFTLDRRHREVARAFKHLADHYGASPLLEDVPVGMQ